MQFYLRHSNLVHRNRNFTSVFDTRTSFRAKGLTFPLGTLEIAILPQFLTLEPRFVREGFIRHAWNRNFTSVFDTRTSFRAWRVHPAHLQSQFYHSFWHSNLVSCVKGCNPTHLKSRNFTSVFDTWRVHPAHLKSQFYLSFWYSNLVSCERVDVSTRHAWNRNFTSVFDTRTSFCAWRVHPARLKSQFYLSFWHSNLVSCVKGSSATLAIAILPQFWTLEPRFVRKGCNRQLKVAILPQFLTLEPRFVREGFIRTSWNRNFTSVFDTRTSFRARGLTFRDPSSALPAA